MQYAIGLLAALAAFWLCMSGQMAPLYLFYAAISLLLVMILVYRLDILDRESAPYGRALGLLAYFSWLVWEILKANWIVIRGCLRANLDIRPALVYVPTRCRSDLGRVIFANSITLTPGTVTVDIEGERLLVHALYEDKALPESFADMDVRAARAGDPAGNAT